MATAFSLRLYKLYLICLLVSGFLIPRRVQAQWEIKHLATSSFLQLGYFGNPIKFRGEKLGLVMNEAGIFRSIDTGETWTSIAHPLPLYTSFYDFDFTNDSLIYATGSNTTGSSVIRSTDGGLHWDSVCALNKQLLKIRFFSEDTGIACGYNGIYRTVNRGQTWDTVWNVVQSGYKFGEIPGMQFLNRNTGFAAAYVRDLSNPSNFSNLLLKTNDGGQTWVKHDSLIPGYTPGIWFLNKDTGFVGAGRYIFKTTDGGATWNSTVVSSLANVNSIHFISDSVGFAAGGIYTFLIGGGTRPVFMMARTTDAGHTWTSLDTIGIPLHSVFFLNEQTGFVSGANQLIMKTGNGFANSLPANYPWYLTYTGLNDPDALPEASVVYPNPFDQFIRISTDHIQSIRIYDMNGVMIKESKNISSSRSINTNDLLPGIYLIQIKNTGGSMSSVKMLKR